MAALSLAYWASCFAPHIQVLSFYPLPCHLLFGPPITHPAYLPLPQVGVTPLHTAAYNGHILIVALLLATPGVDPNARDRMVMSWPTLLIHQSVDPLPPLLQGGATPLSYAQHHGRIDAAALLRADPRVSADGRRS